MMEKRSKFLGIASAVSLIGVSAGATPILWDINAGSNSSHAAAADFTAAGVTEDLSGAEVYQVEGSSTNSGGMAAGGISLVYSTTNTAFGIHAGGTETNAILQEYIYLDNSAPVDLQLSGLDSALEPNSWYAFYLWGIGDSAGQSAKFIVNGDVVVLDNTLDPHTADPAAFGAKFYFRTGDAVSDTLAFQWQRQGRYAGLNGLAIVETSAPEMPEPAPILWDINTASGGTNAAVSDFVEAGVTEDLSGASVSHVAGSAAQYSTMFADNGVSLSYVGELDAKGAYENSADGVNPIIKDYIVFESGNERHMQIGGIGAYLEPSSYYSFYIWGVGDNAGQSGKFVFNGETLSADNSADPDTAAPSSFMVKFTFTTGAEVPNALDFEWHRQGRYSGLNGFAVVKTDAPPVAPSEARTLYWTGAGEDDDMTTLANWAVNTNGTYEPASWGIYADDTLYVGHAGANSESAAVYEAVYTGGAESESHSRIMIGESRTGMVNLDIPAGQNLYFNNANSFIGTGSASGHGTLNINSGRAVELRAIQVGASGGTGYVNVDGASWVTVTSGVSGDYGVGLGSGGGRGTLRLSGSEFKTANGVIVGNGGTGRFIVDGTGPSAIYLGHKYGGWLQVSGGSTLEVNVDEGGLTPIEILEKNGRWGHAVFEAGSLLDVSHIGAAASYGTFDVVVADTRIEDNGLAFAPGVDTNIWSFAFVDGSGDGTNNVLQVTAYGETANGTPYAWLQGHGLSADDDERDMDGDGLTVWQEYIAGTDPNDPDSRFGLTSVGHVKGGQTGSDSIDADLSEGDYVALTWPSVSGRNYSIYRKDNLKWAEWTVLEEGIPGEDGEMTYYYAAPDASTKFYKIGVELAE